jgi:hypothetical protein
MGSRTYFPPICTRTGAALKRSVGQRRLGGRIDNGVEGPAAGGHKVLRYAPPAAYPRAHFMVTDATSDVGALGFWSLWCAGLRESVGYVLLESHLPPSLPRLLEGRLAH